MYLVVLAEADRDLAAFEVVYLLVCSDGPQGHVEYAKLDRRRDALHSCLVKMVPLVKVHKLDTPM